MKQSLLSLGRWSHHLASKLENGSVVQPINASEEVEGTLQNPILPAKVEI